MERECRRFRFSLRPQVTGQSPEGQVQSEGGPSAKGQVHQHQHQHQQPVLVLATRNQQPAFMFQSLAFRTRLLIILAALALVPAIGVTIAWSIGAGRTLPLMGCLLYTSPSP